MDSSNSQIYKWHMLLLQFVLFVTVLGLIVVEGMHRGIALEGTLYTNTYNVIHTVLIIYTVYLAIYNIILVTSTKEHIQWVLKSHLLVGYTLAVICTGMMYLYTGGTV